MIPISDKNKIPLDNTPNKGDYVVGTKDDGLTTANYTLDVAQSLLDADGWTRAQIQTMIENSSLKENVSYKIIDAGEENETIIVTADSPQTFVSLCRKSGSNLDKIYEYNFDTDELSEKVFGSNVLNENDYASNSTTEPPSQSSVKHNDNILKGDNSRTGNTLLFTSKTQSYNVETPSDSNTVVIDMTDAIPESTAIFHADGSSSVTIEAAGEEVILDDTVGDQILGARSELFVAYYGFGVFRVKWMTNSAGGGTVKRWNGVSPDENGDINADANTLPDGSTSRVFDFSNKVEGTGGSPILLNSLSGCYVGDVSTPTSNTIFTIDNSILKNDACAIIYWKGSTSPTFEFTETPINIITNGVPLKGNKNAIIYLRYDGTQIQQQNIVEVTSQDVLLDISQSETASFTAGLAHVGKFTPVNSVSNVSITIDKQLNINWKDGSWMAFEMEGAGEITIVAVDGDVNFNTTKLAQKTQGDIILVVRKSENTWSVIGGVEV